MIAVVVATYGRPALLTRLLRSLAPSRGVLRLFVVDNHPVPSARLVLAAEGWSDGTVIEPGENTGTGGGVGLGMAAALRDPQVRHVLVADDDTVLSANAPERLAAACDAHGAGCVVPLFDREDGTLGWFPGLLNRAKWRVIKRPGVTAEDYLARCGEAPEPFTWSPWPAMVFSRAAIERIGFPRREIWYQGVDLDYVLRLTMELPGLLVPTVRCQHLPPHAQENRERWFYRETSGLQNGFVIYVRSRHGWRAARHLPGNVFRYFQSVGWTPRALGAAALAAWWGLIRARPSGAPGFTYFKDRWTRAGETSSKNATA